MFGQLVIGSPGAGKTTYCAAMQQFLTSAGRKVAVINLDPANDEYKYDCACDLAELVSLQAVQNELGLGPNGGMLYCIDYLAANLDWLEDKLRELQKTYTYFLIDCPGQVELFTIHNSLRTIIDVLTGSQPFPSERNAQPGEKEDEERLMARLDETTELNGTARMASATSASASASSSSRAFLPPPPPPSSSPALSPPAPLRLAAVHLLDATLCTEVSKFIAACLLSLSTMLHLELPHINVLSKVDILERITAAEGGGAIDIELFTNLEDPSILLGKLDEMDESLFSRKYRALSAALLEIVDQYGLVSFAPLNVNDGHLMEEVVKRVDTANGYLFSGRR